MSNPLFTKEEIAAHQRKLGELEMAWQTARDNGGSFENYWSQRTALQRGHEIEETRRAQKRPHEFLDALLLLVSSRGVEYVEFNAAFSNSSDPDYRKRITLANTPETRRNLFTILKALSEIPKSWATSAFIRFLRGTGKQKDAKYHGAGTFGVRYGWKEEEVQAICQVLTGNRWSNNPYCRMLMTYVDVESEIAEEDPDYDLVDYDAKFSATRANRDVAFISALCEILDAQGLGPVPVAAEEKPKKERKVKQFHSGDVIKKSNLRDLPLPAHVSLPIERLDEASKQWLKSTLEIVVTGLLPGRYTFAVIKPGGNIAYTTSNYTSRYGDYKDHLIGATFLGEWSGKIDNKKHLKINYQCRSPGGNYICL